MHGEARGWAAADDHVSLKCVNTCRKSCFNSLCGSIISPTTGYRSSHFDTSFHMWISISIYSHQHGSSPPAVQSHRHHDYSSYGIILSYHRQHFFLLFHLCRGRLLLIPHHVWRFISTSSHQRRGYSTLDAVSHTTLGLLFHPRCELLVSLSACRSSARCALRRK